MESLPPPGISDGSRSDGTSLAEQRDRSREPRRPIAARGRPSLRREQRHRSTSRRQTARTRRHRSLHYTDRYRLSQSRVAGRHPKSPKRARPETGVTRHRSRRRQVGVRSEDGDVPSDLPRHTRFVAPDRRGSRPVSSATRGGPTSRSSPLVRIPSVLPARLRARPSSGTPAGRISDIDTHARGKRYATRGRRIESENRSPVPDERRHRNRLGRHRWSRDRVRRRTRERR